MTSSTQSGGVGLGILEVILHDVVGIQTELASLRGLLGVVDDQELILRPFL